MKTNAFSKVASCWYRGWARWFTGAWLVISFCLPGLLQAQSLAEIDRSYRHRIWQIEDGLPQNSVQAITQTRDGYIWAGTLGGLARFDGVTFTTVDQGYAVTWLCEGNDGSLWIGTDGQGVKRLKRGKFTHFNKGNGLAGSSVRAMLASKDGSIWVACREGVSFFRGTRFQVFCPQDLETNTFVRVLHEDTEGTLWFGTSNGVMYRQNDRLTAIFHSEVPGNLRSFLADRHGTLWMGHGNGLVTLNKDDKAQKFTVANGLAANLVSALFEDSRSNIWVGTYGGLNRINNG